MLKNVLKALGEGKAQSFASLSRQLNISEGMLMQMIEDLTRKGYLSPISENSMAVCGGACGSCGLSCSSCSTAQHSNLNGWVLTEKGFSAIGR